MRTPGPLRYGIGRRRADEQRGAALVEAAIVIMPLLVVMFGIVEYGFVFKDSLTLSNATRSGARVASAASGQSSFMSAASEATIASAGAADFRNGDVIFVYRAQPDGLPASGNADICGTACQAWTFENGVWSRSGGAGWSHTSHNACLSATMDSVGVSIRQTHQSITNFFPFINNMQLRERTVMRLEPRTDDCR